MEIKFLSSLFHVKQLFLFFALTISIISMAQGSISMSDRSVPYHLAPDTALKNRLAVLPGFKSLSEGEQQVAYYLNYARMHPQLFLDNAINIFLQYHPEVKSNYTTSLQKLFSDITPLHFVSADLTLSRVARLHAEDLRDHHILSHNSSNGRSFQERVQPFVKGCGSECIHAGKKFLPIESVLSLLFDFNVPDLGHRKSMLNPDFTRAGFGIAPDPVGNTVLVVDFSCK